MRKIMLLILLFVAVAACDSGSGDSADATAGVASVSADSGTQLKFIGVYEYDNLGSTCAPNSINGRILSLYLNAETNEFKTLNAAEAVHLQGTYSAVGVYTYKDKIIIQDTEETADCYITYDNAGDLSGYDREQLRQVCESKSYLCKTIWKIKI